MLDIERAADFLKRIQDSSTALKSTPIEKVMGANKANPVDLELVMALDGITEGTPLSFFSEKAYRPYLLQAHTTSLLKQRFVNVNYSPLQSNLAVEGGLIGSTVGSIHIPSFIDLCGGQQITMQSDLTGAEGSIGHWRTAGDMGSFRTATNEEFATVSAVYTEQPNSKYYKYGFGVRIGDSGSRGLQTLSALNRWLNHLFLMMEVQLLDDLYKTIVVGVPESERLSSRELGARASGTKYPPNLKMWDALHAEYGTTYGMTDVFASQENKAKIREFLGVDEMATSVLDKRNRMSDGTYVWSHFIKTPREDLLATIDRQSSVSFFYGENSELSERTTDPLLDTLVLTFSVILGFKITDTEGVRVVTID